MPIPISPNNKSNNDKDYYLDYSVLLSKQENKTVEASNKDAENIMRLWANCERVDENQYKLDKTLISSSELMKLKINGFINNNDDDVIEFTARGRNIITTMTLAESNNFLKSKQNRSYKEILASLDKRGKKGYRLTK